MTGIWAVFFDLAVMVLLGATIFYAIRLSRHLDHFRDTRAELAGVMAELAGHIANAQTAIDDMRAHAGQSAINLQALITQSQAVSEELQLINQASDSLANRLESLAERGRKGVESRAAEEAPQSRKTSAPAKEAVSEKPYRTAASPEMFPAFAIRDPDLDTGNGKEEPVWEDENDPIAVLKSQAERDLASALRRRRMGGK